MNQQLYVVEKIVKKRDNKKTGKNQYLVKWVGWPSSQNTWEPQTNLQFVMDMVHEFNSNNISQKNGPEEINPPQKGKDSRRSVERNTKKSKIDQKKDKKKEKQTSTLQDQEKILLPKEQLMKVNKNTEKEVKEEEQVEEIKQQTKVIQKNLILPKTVNWAPPQIGSTDFTIEGINKRGKKLIYLILEDGKRKWMSRKEVIRDNSVDLCLFYQKNMKILDKKA